MKRSGSGIGRLDDVGITLNLEWIESRRLADETRGMGQQMPDRDVLPGRRRSFEILADRVVDASCPSWTSNMIPVAMNCLLTEPIL